MEMTWAGLFFFPLTIFLLLPSIRLSKIALITTFFLPFGSIAVINFPDIPPGFGIGLDRYFSAILIFSVLLFPLASKIKLERIPKQIVISFYLFFLTIMISLIVPLYSNSITIWQYDPVVRFLKVPLEFSNRNISKTIEIIFSALFFMSIYKVMPLVSPKRFTKILISSLLVMCISGFLDFLPRMTSIWQIIKNNVSHPNAIGMVVGHFGEIRLSGLSLEPSHLIIYAGCGLSIMCGFYKNRVHIISRPVDISLLVLFAITVFFTFSSTMLVVFLIASIYLMYGSNPLLNPKFTLSAIILLALAMVFHVQVASILEVLVGNALGKMGLSKNYAVYSDLRSFSGHAAIYAFKQSPLTGIGWGSIILPIGFPLLLIGSVGLFGTLAGGYLICSVFRTAINKLSKKNNQTEKALKEGLILCFSIITVMCLYTKGWQYFLFLPLIFFGASMCASFKKNSRKAENNEK